MVEHTCRTGSGPLPVTVGGQVRALEPRHIDAVFAAVEGLLPPRPVDDHPLGCHRPRIADKTCFTGIVYRLALGCSWVDAARLVGVGQATLRRRRREWIAAGVFDQLVNEGICGHGSAGMGIPSGSGLMEALEGMWLPVSGCLGGQAAKEPVGGSPPLRKSNRGRLLDLAQ